MKKTHKTAFLLLAGASLLLTLSPLAASRTAQAETQSSFTAEQKTELETIFRQFVSDNPQLIMETVQRHVEDREQKAMMDAKESLKEYQKVFSNKNLPMVGNPDGDVTIVEFFDYNCGYCKKAFSDIMKLVDQDKNVRVVFQDLPILSPTSQKMAELSLAAHKQGKYFEFHKALMEYRGTQSDEAFLKVGEGVGLDTEQLKQDAKSGEVQKAISEIKEMSQVLGIRGTPGFIIGNEIYPGYIGPKGLSETVKKAREAAKAK